MKKIPVMHIIDTLNIGGAERMAINLVNGLANSPYEPHLCVTRQLGLAKNEINPDVSLIHLERKSRFDIVSFKKCLAYIRKNDIKIIHAHSTSIFFSLPLTIFSPAPSIIWHIHGTNVNKIPLLKKFFYRLASQNANGIICVSMELASWIKFLKSKKSLVWYLPNFISNPDINSNSDAVEIPNDGFTQVVCVSNLRNPKDHTTLLNAWKIVLKKCPKSRLILIGGVSEKKYAQKVFEQLKEPVLENNVLWLGARTDVPALLRKCQIGVLSSRSEGFPVTLLEYGFAKLGVVATDVGQCAEILGFGKAGLLTPPGDERALAKALIKLISDKALRNELGTRLFENISDHYSQEAIMERLFNIYKELLRQRATGLS